jgi:hypothetical protein
MNANPNINEIRDVVIEAWFAGIVGSRPHTWNDEDIVGAYETLLDLGLCKVYGWADWLLDA